MDMMRNYLQKLIQLCGRKNDKMKRTVSVMLAASLVFSVCMPNSYIFAAEVGQISRDRHEHNFTCRELICEEDHDDGEHTRECFATSGSWVCGLEEGEPHTHNEEGYSCQVIAKELDCQGADEDEITASVSNATSSDAQRGTHTHGDNCYREVYACRAMEKVALMSMREGVEVEEATVHNWTEFTDEIVKASDKAKTGASIKKTIKLEEDEIPGTSDQAFEICEGMDITLDLQGNTLKYEGKSKNNSLFKISGGTLTITSTESDQNIAADYVSYTNEEEEIVDIPMASGAIEADNVDNVILVERGSLNLVNGRITTTNSVRAITSKDTFTMTGGYLVDNNNTTSNPSGGAVLVCGGSEFTMTGGVIANNSAICGGGIYFMSGATVDISGSSYIICNKAETTGTIELKHGGGGIYGIGNNSTLTMTGGVIADNSGVRGGGIFLLDGPTAYISETLISNNSATRYGGGIYQKGADVNISDTVIAKNEVSGTVNGYGGGGIFILGGDDGRIATVDISGESKIIGNQAYEGGAIHGNTNSKCTVIIGGNTVIEENTSTCKPATAAVYVEKGKLIIGTSAKVEGSTAGTGLWKEIVDALVQKKDVELTNDYEVTSEILVDQNITIDLAGHTIRYSGSGGSEESYMISVRNGAILTIKDSSEGNGYIISNVEELDRLITADGGTLVINGGTLTNENGTRAVLADNGGTITMTGGSITKSGRSKISYGGGILLINESHFNMSGGVIEKNEGNTGGGVCILNSNATIGGKASIQDNTAVLGGGIFVQGNSEVCIEGTVDTVHIDNNTATGRDISDSSGGGGGGIYVKDEKSSVIIKGEVSICGNKALTGSGGGIGVRRGQLNIYGGTIDDNISGQYGGGIYINNSNATDIRKVYIGSEDARAVVIGNADNQSVQQSREGNENQSEDVAKKGNKAQIGGGIAIVGNVELTIGEATIGHNVADPMSEEVRATRTINTKEYKQYYGGGGIYANQNTTLILNDKCNIINNSAKATAGIGTEHRGGGGNGGGGIFSAGKIVMNGGRISGNYAEDSGGGVHSYTYRSSDSIQPSQTPVSNFIMRGGTISGNTAKNDEGGGLRIDGFGEITGGYIIGNETKTEFDWGGGGIFVEAGAELTVKDLLVTDNTAYGFGGGVGGCSTSDVSLFTVKGAAIYDNKAIYEGPYNNEIEDGINNNFGLTYGRNFKNDDHVVAKEYFHIFKNGYRDFYCAGNSTVYGKMLGGGDARWIGSYADKVVSSDKKTSFVNEDTINKFIKESYSSTGWMALTAQLDEDADGLDETTKESILEAKWEAEDAAKVFIENNISHTHGGGIMSNGRLILGEDRPEPPRGSLTVEKKWVKDNVPTDSHTPIKIKLLRKRESATSYKEYKTYSLSADNGWEHTWTDLKTESDDGEKYSYKVEEEGVPADYNVSYTYKVQRDAASNDTIEEYVGNVVSLNPQEEKVITITNSKENNTNHTGSLQITKGIAGAINPDDVSNNTFTFHIYKATDSGSKGALVQTVPITGAGTCLVSDLEPGTYIIEEKNNVDAQVSGYTLSIPGDETVEVSAGQISSRTLVNTYTKEEPNTGSLIISKNIIGLSEPYTKEYEFEITKDDDPTFKRTVYITGEGIVSINGLLFGDYTVREVGGNIDGYIHNVRISNDGQVSLSPENSSQTVTVTNTYTQPGTGNLQITKTVTGSAGETQRYFTFTVTLTDAAGNALTGTYDYIGSKTGTINSGGTITLKHGETVTITKLPKDTCYQVVEREANQDRYTTTQTGGTGSDSDVIVEGETAVVSFTNARRPGGGGRTPGPDPDPDPGPDPGPGNPPPPPENPDNPPTTPDFPPELPDPNDPDSPERVTILENGVPRTYVKVWDPENEEFIYIPEEDVPLFGLPKMGDGKKRGWMEMFFVLSTLGVGTLTMDERRKKKKEER